MLFALQKRSGNILVWESSVFSHLLTSFLHDLGQWNHYSSNKSIKYLVPQLLKLRQKGFAQKTQLKKNRIWPFECTSLPPQTHTKTDFPNLDPKIWVSKLKIHAPGTYHDQTDFHHFFWYDILRYFSPTFTIEVHMYDLQHYEPPAPVPSWIWRPRLDQPLPQLAVQVVQSCELFLHAGKIISFYNRK